MRRLGLVLIASLPAMSGAFAERVPGEDERKLLPGASNGPASSAVETPRAYAEIEAGKDSSRVSLKISRSAHTNPVNWGTRKEVRTNVSAWTVTFAAPLNKKDKDTDVANLDGLANSFSVALKWTRFDYWRSKPTDADDRKFCDRLGEAQAAELDTDNERQRKEAAKKIADACFDEFDSEKAYAAGPEWGREYEAMYWPDRPRWVYGAEAKIGTEDFEFLDTQTFAEREQSETPWSVGGFVGVSKPDWGLTYLGFRYEEAFEEQKQASICTPIENSTALSCETKPLGAPAGKDKAIVFVEHRRHLGQFAISPRVSRDFESNVTGVDFPVYFWKDKDGNLAGGIKAGWTSDEDGLDFSLFIGATFSFFD